MKVPTWSIRTLLGIVGLTLLAAVSAQEPSDAMEGLNESQRYRVYPYVQRGFDSLEQGNYQRAIDAFSRARERVPEHAPIRRYLARSHMRAGNYRDGLAVLDGVPGSQALADEIRTRMIAAGEASADTVTGWLADSADPAALVRATADRLAAEDGDRSALDWLSGLDCEFACEEQLRLTSVYAERSGRPAMVVDALDRLAAQADVTLDPEQRRRSAFALANLGRYDEAIRAIAGSPDEPVFVREIRRRAVTQGDVSAARLRQWLGESPEPAVLLRARAQALAERDGDSAALAWLTGLPCDHACPEQLRLTSVYAERAGQHGVVRDSLQRLRRITDGPLLSIERERLVLATLALGEYRQALAATESWRESDPARERLMRQVTQSAVASGATGAALDGFARLDGLGTLTQTELAQWHTLAINAKRGELALRLGERRGLSCARQTEVALELGLGSRADRIFTGCTPGNEGRRWLRVAERLDAMEAVAAAEFNSGELARLQQAILAGRYERSGDWEALVDLLQGSAETEAEKRQLAQALAWTGRHQAAAETWYRLYRQMGDLSALDRASYLTLRAGDRQRAIDWLADALPLPAGETGDALRERLLNLMAADPAAADAARLATLASNTQQSKARVSLATIYQRRGECERVEALLRGIEGDARAWLVRAECATAPGVRIAYRERALELGADRQDRQLAYDYAGAGDPEAALGYWQRLPSDSLSPRDRMAYALVALETGRMQRAEVQWQQIPETQRDAETWALGGRIAVRQGDTDLAIERWRQAYRGDRRAGTAYRLGKLFRDTDQLGRARHFFRRAVELDPDDGRYQAELGFTLSSSDPEAAIAALEEARELGVDNDAVNLELGFLYQRTGRRDDASAAFKRGIDDLAANRPKGGAALTSWRERDYQARRAHETLTDQWQFNIAGYAATASVPGDALSADDPVRHLAIGEAERAFAPDTVPGPGRWFAFSRFFTDGTKGSAFSNQTVTAGIGWRPGWGDTALSAEYTFGDLSADPKSGVLFRIGRTWLDGGELRTEWRPSEDRWWEHALQTSAAYWWQADAEDGEFLHARYDLRRHWKLDSRRAQSLFAYPLAEAQLINDEADARVGAGVGWRAWANESRYDAYRNRYELRLEAQQVVAGDLSEEDFGIFLRWSASF